MYQPIISFSSLFWISKTNCDNDNQLCFLCSISDTTLLGNSFPFYILNILPINLIPLHQHVDLKTNLLVQFSCQRISTVFSETTPLLHQYARYKVPAGSSEVVFHPYKEQPITATEMWEDSSFLGTTTLTLNILQPFLILLK